MPVPGGTTEKLSKADWPHFRKRVALAVALVFQLDVVGRRPSGVPNSSTITEWSMTRSTGTSGLILLRVAAERHHGVAHGGEVDHGRHAGEVLHQHAGGPEGDLLLDLAAVVEPGDDGLDVGLLDRAAVLEAQQVLEQHLHGEGQAGDVGEAVLLGIGME